jgi:hypothetical protein
VGLALGELGKLNQLQHVAHTLHRLGFPHTAAQQAVGYVRLDRHVREQGIGLEHHVRRSVVGRDRGHVLPVDLDPAFGRQLEACKHPEQRRFSAARSAKQAEQLSLVDVQADVVDSCEVAELLGDLLDADERFGAWIKPGLVDGGGLRLRHDGSA